jgi:hypothetical protein
MTKQEVDREKLRRASWRMLEPDLNEFWDDYRTCSGYDGFNAQGKLIAIRGAREVIDLVVEYRRELLAGFPEPTRTDALMVLGECEVLINQFFTRLEASVSS